MEPAIIRTYVCIHNNVECDFLEGLWKVTLEFWTNAKSDESD